ncbi:MAG: peptidylprolyl isomerase [Prevotella sp.]|nr:peptidylprolyl isomerase [Candidatus Prevotella equi]
MLGIRNRNISSHKPYLHKASQKRVNSLEHIFVHRVIQNFMIQGGDPNSRNASPTQMLGTGGPDYTIEAEIIPSLFHKRGALAAARQGDEVNPERRSSGSQFYIAWGQIYTDNQMNQMEKQLQMMAEQQCFQRLANERKAEIMDMRRNRDREGLMALQEELTTMAKSETKNKSVLSKEQREAYTTIGGVPHLDGQYTVFGEVTEGLDIVEKIQQCKTRPGDRPEEDIKILSTTITEE